MTCSDKISLDTGDEPDQASPTRWPWLSWRLALRLERHLGSTDAMSGSLFDFGLALDQGGWAAFPIPKLSLPASAYLTELNVFVAAD